MRVIKVNVDEELITRSGTQKNLINVNNRQSPVEVKKGIGTLVGLEKRSSRVAMEAQEDAHIPREAGEGESKHRK